MIKKLIRRVFGNAAAQTPSASSPALQNSNRQTIPVSKHGIDLDLVSPAARSVCEGLQDAGYEAYIVGGAVRDMLLGREPKDFDIATNATPEQVVREFRRARLIGKRFKIVHVMSGRETIEVTTFRADKDANAQTDVHGRVLSDNNFGDIASDAARRDFTVNAMYYDPSDEVVLDFRAFKSFKPP